MELDDELLDGSKTIVSSVMCVGWRRMLISTQRHFESI